MDKQPEKTTKTRKQAERPPFECTALVLQGGGALGAYQAGVFEGLVEAKVEPDWIAGISMGGGAHGAFTWGVIDYLLEDGRLSIEAITGASAGAMNAVVLLEGWIEGGPEGARAQLRQFWKRVSLDGVLSPLQRSLFERFLGYWSADGSPAHLWLDAWLARGEPVRPEPARYQSAPRRLEGLIDFDSRSCVLDTKLFVAATNVWSGKIRIFTAPELTVDHVLASTCLPMLFKAVEIDGEPYWDGGYSAIRRSSRSSTRRGGDDILLVQINPLERRSTPRDRRRSRTGLPKSPSIEPAARTQSRSRFVTRLIDAGKLSTKEYKRVRMHRPPGG